jgi:hypothetical protein
MIKRIFYLLERLVIGEQTGLPVKYRLMEKNKKLYSHKLIKMQGSGSMILYDSPAMSVLRAPAFIPSLSRAAGMVGIRNREGKDGF